MPNIFEEVELLTITYKSTHIIAKSLAKISNKFKTLFLQEMAKNRILISPSWISFSYSHGNKELEITKKALKKTLLVYKKAISKGINKYLKSDVVKPVFRKYN